MKKKILLAFIAGCLLIQFFRPGKNNSADRTHAVTNLYPMSAELSTLFDNACYDCHSNATHYPWYAEVQPIAWWLANHVNEGKSHLNFDAFTHRRLAWQYHKFEETIEMVEKKEMPLASYTYLGLHPEAKLTDDQRHMIISWAKTQMDSMRARHPSDSLVMKRR